MKKTKVFLIIALMCAVVQGAWAQFDVTKDATMSEDWTLSPANPVTSGQTVTATYTGSKHVKSVKFVKKMRTPEVTAPTAKSLTYTAALQALVNAGSTTGGTLQYKLGTDGTYSTDVPTATNAGTYTVYYKVVGDEAYSDVDEASVSVTIAKAQATAKSSKSDWLVGDIICSNGNAYTINANTTIPSGTTATAIVAYKGSATGDADYKNGLAFALTDANPSGDTGGYVLAWKSTSGASDNSSKMTQEYPTTAESGRALTIDGVRNALTSTARLGWPAFNYAARYNVARPSVASVWFLPSIYQWNLMTKTLLGVSSNLGFTANANMAYGKINAKLQSAIDDSNVKAAGLADGPYWTASEYDNNRARCYRAGGQAGYGNKTDAYRVRPIIAF